MNGSPEVDMKIDSGCSQTSVNRKLISEGSIKKDRKSTVGYVGNTL